MKKEKIVATKSKIEWTDATWNPIVGCTKMSAGCDNCYAIRQAHRMASNPAMPQYHGTTKIVNGKPNWTGKMGISERALVSPLSVKRPTRYFVNSMGDLFHEGVSDNQLRAVFVIIEDCPQHTFQILTKRPQRMQKWMSGHYPDALPNVWLGVSIEDQKTADERIPLLLQTPAAVRFVSAEPLLGPVNMTMIGCPHCGHSKQMWAPNYVICRVCGKESRFPPNQIDWLIVGGESGPGARPMHPDWARSLRDQCKAADVPFFFKQWGLWSQCDGWNKSSVVVYDDGQVREQPFGSGKQEDRSGVWMYRAGKKISGRLLDGVEHNGMPCFAEATQGRPV